MRKRQGKGREGREGRRKGKGKDAGKEGKRSVPLSEILNTSLPTNHSFSQKTLLNVLSYGTKKSGHTYLAFSFCHSARV